MTTSEARRVLEALAAADAERRPAALATVISTRGSTPRRAGARMLVFEDGALVGTVGGGCGEAQVIEAARRVLAGGPPERVAVDLTEDLLTWSPAVCGGIMDVLVEAV